jgi:hypothetical protein
MYRVVAILGGALTLAACSSAEFGNLDAFKPAPVMDTVSFETEPAGADVKVSNGQTCKTPCALALPSDQPLNVTFSLAGYDSATETLAPIVATGSPPRLNPNPVTAELSPATAKPAKPRTTRKPKPASKKPVAAKPATKTAAKPAPTPAAAAPATTAPPTFAPAPAASSPWPAPPPPQR